MLVKTKIGSNGITFSWKGKLETIKQKEVTIKYDVDVSKTPKHLANFMFGILFSEQLSWGNTPIEFDELTEKEQRCLSDHVKMNHMSNPYGLVKSPKPIKMTAKRIVANNPIERSGPILCANGMGKDSLSLANMVKELDLDMRCFIIRSTLKADLWSERVSTMNKFYQSKSIMKNTIIPSTLENFRIVPWLIFCLPLAYHYKSKNVLAGLTISFSQTHVKRNTAFRPNVSIFSLNYLSKALGINFSSPFKPLSEFATQTLLTERYPESLKYQRSCMYGTPWCNNKGCSKCTRSSLYLSLLGKDLESIGLKPFKRKKPYTREDVSLGIFCLNNARKKLLGQPYNTCIEGVNSKALDLIWNKEEFGKIYAEHFELYDYDPGPTANGYTISPSKWRGWIDTDFVKMLEDTEENEE